ncbi:MAG: hypothetical protein CSA65_07110 [Proteobacteria bacterium]|nr:MAG: hypothetical protein CSA65_07110 [Pseudomonadota bacterium]
MTLALGACLALAAPFVGCGGDDETDPVPGLCKTRCKLEEADSCFSQMATCLAGCEKIGIEMYKTGFKPTDCAKCFIEKIAYSRNPDDQTQCWGVTLAGKDLAGADKNLPACQSVCVDPDA